MVESAYVRGEIDLDVLRHGFDVCTQVHLAGIGYVDFLLHGCLIVEIAFLHLFKRHAPPPDPA